MDLTQLANLGEFIGGVAVLVTLIYLALQVRRSSNSRGERAAALRELTEQWNGTLVVRSREPAVSPLFGRAIAKCRVCIAGFLILIGTAWVACGDERPPGPGPGEVSSESGSCTEDQVIESARRVTREYCSGTNGCDFNPRLEVSASDGQGGTEASEEWIVVVSLIHSFDEAGQPRFMPEGARIVRVSTDCTPTSVLGHGGPVPMPEP